MDGLVWGIVAVVAVAALAIAAKIFNVGQSGNRLADHPRLADDLPIAIGFIHVIGWSERELATILDDFAAKTRTARTDYKIVRRPNNALRIIWTRPIRGLFALHLVHHIHFPRNEALPVKPCEAVAVIPVPADMVPGKVSAQALAKVFVPTDKAAQNGVHALLPDGRVFRSGFVHRQWQPTTAAKASALAQSLPFAIDP